MSDARIPVLNPMFRLQWEQAQDAWVLLYPEGMVTLNGSAGEIMHRVDGQRSIAEIVAELQAEFPQVGDLSDDVGEFIEQAAERGWITFV